MALGAAPAVIDVSVIVPVYNKAKYLPELLESLRAQTHGSFDVWLVDDGSDDGSETMCDEVSAADPRFHVIHQPNSGWPGKPRNTGIDASAGRFVFFADADDRCEPTMLADLVSFADAHDCDIVLPLVGTDTHWRKAPTPGQTTAPPLDMFSAFKTLTPHKLFRRDYLDQHDLRFTERRVPLEDGRMLARAYTAGGRIGRFADRVGYHYLGREGTNISYAPRDPRQQAESVSDILDQALTTDDGPQIVLELYRRKLLRYLGPRFLLRESPQRAAAWVGATADIADRYVSEELEDQLLPWQRLVSRTARLRNADLSVALANARNDEEVPAVRRSGHWYIGPICVDDFLEVEVKARKIPIRGVRVLVKPDWVNVPEPQLSMIYSDGISVVCADGLRPASKLVGPTRVLAAWDDLKIAVTYEGEPLERAGMRFETEPGGYLSVSPA